MALLVRLQIKGTEIALSTAKGIIIIAHKKAVRSPCLLHLIIFQVLMAPPIRKTRWRGVGLGCKMQTRRETMVDIFIIHSKEEKETQPEEEDGIKCTIVCTFISYCHD